MGIFIVGDCFSGNTYEVDFGSFEVNPSEVWSFSGINETIFCGTIMESSESLEGDYTGITQYTDCYDCFTGNGFSVTMSECGGLFDYYQLPTGFNSVPRLGEVYNFCNPEDSDECYCFEVVDFTTEAEFAIDAINNGGPFNDCIICLDFTNQPRSANTETFICIPDCEFTGSTAVAPPHPVWTDGYGTPVTQLNMVLIGSGNGLNG